MAAIGRPRRLGTELPPDDPIVRRIEDAFTSMQLDALYRRRLRTEVVNRYVAVREGHAAARPAARPLAHRGVMGRLGRACLYASVALAGSTVGVLAASQSALPGDALYDVKLRIDALRLEAAPANLRTAVAEYIVGERLNELTVLAADGEWARAADAAAATGASAQQLAGLLAADSVAEARIQRHLAVLAGLVETAPPAARDALTHAMAMSGAALEHSGTGEHGGSGNVGGNGGDDPITGGSGNGAGSGSSGGSPGGNGANAGGNGADAGGNGANGSGDDADESSVPDSPAPSPSSQDAEPSDDRKGDGGDRDTAGDEAAATVSPLATPRASLPPQADQGNH
jgi:hypothetical protein